MVALKNHNLRPNKSLGQNFLTDKNAIAGIIAAIDPGPSDLIIEIGPGLGALTMPLARPAGRVGAVEIDSALAALLRKELDEEGLSNTEIIHGDFLKTDLSDLCRNLCRNKHKKIKIVGSLPYYITKPCLKKIFAFDCSFGKNVESVTLVIQKEAAERLAASPGDKNYGVMTLEAAYYGEAGFICNLPPSSFYPQPNVYSKAIIIRPHKAPPVRTERELLFKVIGAAFFARRKTLENSLALGLGISRERAASAINKCGFAADVRGERLGLADFNSLAENLF